EALRGPLPGPAGAGRQCGDPRHPGAGRGAGSGAARLLRSERDAVTSSSSTPTIAGPESPLPPPATAEPEVLRRERAVLHEILRLVAERSAAEAKVGGTRASNDTKADSEYQKARAALTEK